MTTTATTPDEYIASLPPDRVDAMTKLRKVIKKNLPKGFSEQMCYGQLAFVVPHKLYAPGYHCNPKLPLMFLSMASQKNFIAIYHMGIYSDPKLLNWFVDAYAELNIGKLDMGKSCIRFKKMENIPFDLLGELATKMTVNDWVNTYEKMLNRK